MRAPIRILLAHLGARAKRRKCWDRRSVASRRDVRARRSRSIALSLLKRSVERPSGGYRRAAPRAGELARAAGLRLRCLDFFPRLGVW